MIHYVALALALSIDALAAAFAYGSNKIKIQWTSVLIAAGVCSVFLGISLVLGKLLTPLLKPESSRVISFLILFALGFIKLFEFAIKAFIRRKKVVQSSIGFSFASLHFILDIYADPMDADMDYSKSLSAGEAVTLAIALSLDGLAAGFGYSLSGGLIVPVILISFLFGICAIKAGEYLGRVMAVRSTLDLSWMSGVILILLAVFKL